MDIHYLYTTIRGYSTCAYKAKTVSLSRKCKQLHQWVKDQTSLDRLQELVLRMHRVDLLVSHATVQEDQAAENISIFGEFHLRYKNTLEI